MTSAFKSAQLSACLIPGHSRLQQPAVGLLPQHYLIGEGVSLPELLSAPLSSVGAQPATLMAAAPVRQRSGPAGPRAQLPPCYYEGYLEKRGPKEKVGSPDADQVPCCCRCMLWIAVVSVNMRSTPADPSIPRELSTSLLCTNWARRESVLGLLGIAGQSGSQICGAVQPWFGRSVMEACNDDVGNPIAVKTLSFKSLHGTDLRLFACLDEACVSQVFSSPKIQLTIELVIYMCSDSLISELHFQILKAMLLTVKTTISYPIKSLHVLDI